MVHYICIRLDYFYMPDRETLSSSAARSSRIALLPTNASLLLPLLFGILASIHPGKQTTTVFSYCILPSWQTWLSLSIIFPPPHFRAVSPVSVLPSQTSPQGEPSSSWDCHITAQVAGWLVNHTWEKLWVLVLKGYTTICRA